MLTPILKSVDKNGGHQAIFGFICSQTFNTSKTHGQTFFVLIGKLAINKLTKENKTTLENKLQNKQITDLLKLRINARVDAYYND